jgi:serine/threonine protein kinase
VSSADPLVGKVLAGRYRVDAMIGRGGFATVYRGHHLRLDSAVAIKVLRFADDASADDRALVMRRFDEECRLITRLRNDHIVRTLDQGLTEADAPEDQRPYLVTELCSEGTLDTLLKPSRGKGFALSIAWPLMKAILDGLAYAHREGVAHRDLKPQNLMLAKDAHGRYTPRLIDFGIAKLFDADAKPGSGATLSQVPSVCTPTYAAPEQCVGARTGPWTDVHAVGLVFVEMLTGRFAYPETDDLREIVMAAIDPARPTPKSLGVDVGPFEPIIAKALALRPKDRYRDAGEMREACLDAARSLALESVRQPVSTDTLPLVRRRQLTPAAADIGNAETQPDPSRTLESPVTPGTPLSVVAREPLRASEPAVPPKNSRSRLALVLLVLSLFLCGGVVLAARRAMSAALRPAPDSLLPPITRVKLADVSHEALRETAKKLGYTMVTSSTTSAPYLTMVDDTGFAATVMFLDSRSSLVPVLVALGDRMRSIRAGNAIYGVQGDRGLLFYASGQDEALRRAWNRITAGIELDIVGDNMGGPDPATASSDAYRGPKP